MNELVIVQCDICQVLGTCKMLADRSGLVRPMCVECARVCSSDAQITHDANNRPHDGPRLLHPTVTADNVARVHVGLSLVDLQEIIEQRPRPELVLRMLRATKLLDPDLAAAYASAYDIIL